MASACRCMHISIMPGLSKITSKSANLALQGGNHIVSCSRHDFVSGMINLGRQQPLSMNLFATRAYRVSKTLKFWKMKFL